VVSYKVKVKLVMGGLAADVSLFLPFSLMHSKPVNDSDNQRRQDAQDALSIRQEINSVKILHTCRKITFLDIFKE
jgi:ribosomal protein S1